jgi:hypothetical protein
MSGHRHAAAAAFSVLLDIPNITRLVQRGRDPELARYTLELADGRTIKIGTIKILWSQAELSKVLAVTVGCVPLSVDAKEWRGAIRALIIHCTDVEETPNETFEATVMDWVRAYSQRASSDRDGAAPTGLPFTDSGDLYITANGLAKYVRREYSEQVKLHDLRQALRDNQFEQDTVHYSRKVGRGTKRSSTSYYRASIDAIDE